MIDSESKINIGRVFTISLILIFPLFVSGKQLETNEFVAVSFQKKTHYLTDLPVMLRAVIKNISGDLIGIPIYRGVQFSGLEIEPKKRQFEIT